MPVTPHRPAGWRIEPPVSLPIGKRGHAGGHGGRRPAAGAAGNARRCPRDCASFWKAEFSFEPPMANSSMFVLPMNTASAARSRAMTVASYGGTEIFEHPRGRRSSASLRCRRVLDRDGQSGQPAQLLPATLFDGFRLPESFRTVDVQEGFDLLVVRHDLVEKGRGDIDGRVLARLHS